MHSAVLTWFERRNNLYLAWNISGAKEKYSSRPKNCLGFFNVGNCSISKLKRSRNSNRQSKLNSLEPIMALNLCSIDKWNPNPAFLLSPTEFIIYNSSRVGVVCVCVCLSPPFFHVSRLDNF